MSERIKMLVIGGSLVLAGFLVGTMNVSSTPTAEAATTLPENWSPFRGGSGAIVTQSADGKTLYLWAPKGNSREQLLDRAAPVYVGAIQAPGQAQR